jgi:filamentous hemagglutinin
MALFAGGALKCAAAQKYARGQYMVGKLDQYGQRINNEIVLPGEG